MPSASSAKLEKQASSEAIDPIKQGIIFVEHKIRNLLKKKGRLDTYRETQKSGKELDSDQKQALLKYDELCQNLIFAQDLSKQLNNIAVEWSKLQKKKEKKEAYEREQQETARVKEILIIQDVLASMGSENVREDFLAGRNKAVKLTDTELLYLDDIFTEVSPKREPEENQPTFQEQVQNAAKHLLSIVEGKDKEIVGTKYSVLKEIIEKINGCGYFDNSSAPEPVQEVVEEAVQEEIQPVETEAVIQEVEPEPVPQSNFQHNTLEPVAPIAETAGLYISQRPMADVLTNVMGAGATTFNFIQESELEPEVVAAPAAMAIPTQTFTNASFAPPAPTAAPVYAPPPQAEVLYAAAAQPPQPVPSQQFESSTDSYQNTSQATTGGGDWNDAPEQSSDWATQVDQSQWSESVPQSDDWAENSNDGFQTAGRGGGRGGRGRGGGSDRGRGGPRGRGGYQNGRGNNQNGRGGYYNNRNNGEGGNYYQNGYQSRGEGYRDNREGGSRRGGPRGGGQDRGGPRDRGAPRGNARGGNPRGGYRGSR